MDTNRIKLSDIKAYLINQGIDISQNNTEEFINSCFAESDTKNEQGQIVDGGDGFLSEIELGVFLKKVSDNLSDVYGNLLEFAYENTKKFYEINRNGFNISKNTEEYGRNFDKEGNEIRNIREEKIFFPDGTLSSRICYDFDKNIMIKERYHKDGTLGLKEVYFNADVYNDIESSQDKYLSERIIYKNNEIFLNVKYDKNGAITDTTKNLPEGEIDFNEELLNGEFDADFTQGQSGVCYLASGVKSLLMTEKGRALLKNVLKYDKENGLGYVTFDGFKKEYTFTKQEINESMTRLGTGDPDFTLLCLGYEKYREENGKRVDGGRALELLTAIGINSGISNYNLETNQCTRINDFLIASLQYKMRSGDTFATAGTFPNLPNKALEKGLLPQHDYYIKNTDFKSALIIVSDAAVKKDITLTEEEFKEWFGIFEYAVL